LLTYALFAFSFLFPLLLPLYSYCFFFNASSTTEIYTLSLHDALPILDGKLLYLKVPAGNLELDEERSSTSYVFTLSKNNVVTSVFVPNSSYPDYIDLYLSNISL